jgi:nucleotide-binding universal stress UspA family protein
LGRTTDAILQGGAASVLLLPASDGEDRPPRYKRLLVALDGSANSESVLPVVARLAKTTLSSQVILAHIAQQPDDVSQKPSDAPFVIGGHAGSHIAPRARAVDRDYLETWKARLVRQGIASELCFGSSSNPGEGLGEIASQRDVDLIVVSSHGQTNRASTAYGSVTAFLAQTAPCPLFIIRPDLRTSTIAKEQSGRLAQASAQDAELAS